MAFDDWGHGFFRDRDVKYSAELFCGRLSSFRRSSDSLGGANVRHVRPVHHRAHCSESFEDDELRVEDGVVVHERWREKEGEKLGEEKGGRGRGG